MIKYLYKIIIKIFELNNHLNLIYPVNYILVNIYKYIIIDVINTINYSYKK